MRCKRLSPVVDRTPDPTWGEVAAFSGLNFEIVRAAGWMPDISAGVGACDRPGGIQTDPPHAPTRRRPRAQSGCVCVRAGQISKKVETVTGEQPGASYEDCGKGFGMGFPQISGPSPHGFLRLMG